MTDPKVEDWYWAGLGEPDNSGDLGRSRHSHDQWAVPPEVWLEPQWGRLYYGGGWWPRPNSRPAPDIDVPFEPAQIGADMLGEFARLTAGDDGDILEFVRRYGVLGLCKHDVPRAHDDGSARLGAADPPCRGARRPASGRLPGSPHGDFWEPLEVWRSWSGRARAILSIAARLCTANQGARADWDTLLEGGPWWHDNPGDLLGRDPVQEEGTVLAEEVDAWITVTGATLGARWDAEAGAMTARTRAESVLGAIGLQLLLTISGAGVWRPARSAELCSPPSAGLHPGGGASASGAANKLHAARRRATTAAGRARRDGPREP